MSKRSSEGLTPEQRRRRARIAAHASWAKTIDRRARTSADTKASANALSGRSTLKVFCRKRFARSSLATLARLTCCSWPRSPREHAAADSDGVLAR
jgi:hypothetical protein